MSSDLDTIPEGPLKLNEDDYAVLPDDGRRYEIIDGRLYVSPAPGATHQRVSRWIQYAFMRDFEEKGMGEVFNAPFDVVLTFHDIVQPDLVVIRKANLPIIEERGVRGTPDLVVEILSPSTRRTDIRVKALRYAELGVPRYWIVDPKKKRIEFSVLQGTVYATEGTATPPGIVVPPGFPEVTLDLARIFA